MRKLLFILLSIVPIVVSAQDYYWYDGAKKYLPIGNKEYVIYEPHTAMGILNQENKIYSNNPTLKTEIKSAQEMQENGVGINELQTQLLQKIEELTLYILQQEERIRLQEERIDALEKK